MDLRWLEDFLALAEHRTFARAAAFRHVTQPAFGRRIRTLEEWFGTPLFVRSAQGAVLTPAGRFLRTPAQELTRNVYQLRQATLEIADREASTLSIAATHALSFVFFPSWIRSHALFETIGPLNLISDTMEGCEEIMRRGEADFLLCHYHRDAGTRLEPSQFTSVVVGEDILLPLCAPDSKGAPQWPLPGHAETPLPLLSYGPKSGLGRILDAVQAKERGSRSISARAISGFVRAVRYSVGTPARSNRARLLVQLSGRNNRNASMTGTSPRASVSDTSVWQLAVLPSAEAYCGATPTECAPFLAIAVSSITSTASLPPTSRSA
jgi:DNA-binding transcriptional LysR family regulator